MYSFRFFSKLFGIELNNPDLYTAQYKSMARQTPWLYLIVITASIAVAYLNRNQAPIALTIYLPIALIIGDLAFFAWFMVIPKNLTKKQYARAALIRLHSTIWSSVVLGFSYAAWTIYLFKFGDTSLRGLNTAFVSLSTFGVALCLMHLRASAMTIIVCVIGPLVIFFWQTGIPAHMTSAVNMGIVACVFAILLNWYQRDFSQLIKQQQLVAAEKTKVEELNQVNITLANEDSLTGLANRRNFLSHLNEQVENARNGESDGLAVGILDLDGFKQINDIYGHPMGDRLLIDVGKRLKELLCTRIFIARLGGDEFGVLVNGKPDEGELIEIGNLICDAIKTPFEMDGIAIRLGGSVGFAVWRNSKDKGIRLFEKADYALYHAKANTRGSVTIFNREHAEAIRKTSAIDRAIQEADFEKEMYLVFQPIVSPKNARTTGFEVLARWQSPMLGKIMPMIFIESAERIGMINKLTAVLLTKALEEAKNWPDDLFMSFNLSMQDITSSTAVLKLVTIVNNSGFDPRRITFEITETAVMNNYAVAMESLNLLKAMGSKIALDDFGTGHSSLSYVRTLPLDKLKLDRSFVTELEDDEDASSILDMMIEMCRSLNVECIVEGVETLGQLGILESMGCENIQGYYFSRPLSGLDALKFITSEQGDDVQAEKKTA